MGARRKIPCAEFLFSGYALTGARRRAAAVQCGRVAKSYMGQFSRVHTGLSNRCGQWSRNRFVHYNFAYHLGDCQSLDRWVIVFVVFSVVVFPVIINTEAGIRNTDRTLIEAVRSFGATRTQIFFKVSLPSSLSYILAGLRIGIGRGLIGVVVGEMFGARAGLGFLILQSAEVFNMPRLFAGVLLLAVAGIAMTAAFHALERFLVPWRRDWS